VVVPDLNLLLYAYNPHATHQAAARAWWEHLLRAGGCIRTMGTSLAFLACAGTTLWQGDRSNQRLDG
jgi:hypothetical protein